MTLQQAIEAITADRFFSCPVKGDCMEDKSIFDGDTVCVDTRHMPNVGDVCLCFAQWVESDPPTVMVKEFLGRWGREIMVATQYSHDEFGMRPDGTHLLNRGFGAFAVFGIVYACYAPDGTARWEFNPADRPTSLDSCPAHHGVNCGTPKHFVQAMA